MQFRERLALNLAGSYGGQQRLQRCGPSLRVDVADTEGTELEKREQIGRLGLWSEELAQGVQGIETGEQKRPRVRRGGEYASHGGLEVLDVDLVHAVVCYEDSVDLGQVADFV